jgi:hypothetical protein
VKGPAKKAPKIESMKDKLELFRREKGIVIPLAIP